MATTAKQPWLTKNDHLTWIYRHWSTMCCGSGWESAPAHALNTDLKRFVSFTQDNLQKERACGGCCVFVLNNGDWLMLVGRPRLMMRMWLFSCASCLQEAAQRLGAGVHGETSAVQWVCVFTSCSSCQHSLLQSPVWAQHMLSARSKEVGPHQGAVLIKK